MAEDQFNELVPRKYVVINLVLTFLFWVVFTRILLPFVPAQTITWQYIWAAFTALCLTGVFFLAAFMFRLVLAENLKAKRERGE